MFDLQKTHQLAQLLSQPQDARTAEWLGSLQDVVLEASLAARDPQVIQGPDGFPYFALDLPPEAKEFTAFCVAHILEHCTDRGFGIVLEPNRTPPGWVFTYGTLWSLRARGRFLWDDTPSGVQTETLAAGEERQVLVGAPDETLVPPWARATLRRYLQACGVETPMFSLVMDSTREPTQNLVFNVEPTAFAERGHFDAFMQRLTYLPVLYIGGDEVSVRFVI